MEDSDEGNYYQWQSEEGLEYGKSVGKGDGADIIIVGTPVYYNYPTGQVRSFLERLLFPEGTYLWENGKQIVIRDKVIPTGLIYTMNCPEDMMQQWNYPAILSDTAKTMEQIMGYNELLYICNTYQFSDYSRYDMNLFNEEEKRNYRDEHFEADLEKAYQMGKHLVEKAKELTFSHGLDG